MPTFDSHPRFERELVKLTREQRAQWMRALRTFISAVKSQQFPPQLRVKRIKSAPGVWEMTWAANGRATFEYGDELRPGEPHVVWRHVGTHDILKDP